MRIITAIFIATILPIVIVMIWNKPSPSEDIRVTYKQFIIENKAFLEQYVNQSDAARKLDIKAIDKINQDGLITSITEDSNGNTYFICRDSFVTFNVGFLHKKDQLMGDGQEPNLNYTEQLFDNWFYYKAN